MSNSLRRIARLQDAVRKLIQAELQSSWKGAHPPSEHPGIDETLRKARARYAKVVEELKEPAP